MREHVRQGLTDTLTLADAVDRYQREDLGPRRQKPDTARKAQHNLDIIKTHFGRQLRVHELRTAVVSRHGEPEVGGPASNSEKGSAVGYGGAAAPVRHGEAGAAH